MSVLYRFLKKYKHGSGFDEFANTYLADVAAFRLDYCMSKQVPDGQWVSENYLAYVRMFGFIYGSYCEKFKPSQGDRWNNSVQWSEWDRDVLWMQRLVNAFSVMMAALMSPDPNPDPHLLDRKIRLFLTMCHRFGVRVLGESDENYFWELKGKSMCRFTVKYIIVYIMSRISDVQNLSSDIAVL